MNKYINVYSEIGKLNRVMLHRPSEELKSLTPSALPKLLFDDIPYLKETQREHDFFSETLRIYGVEVVYLEQYLKDIFIHDEVRLDFITDYLKQNTVSEAAFECIFDYLKNLSLDEFIESLFKGIRKDEIKNYVPKTLHEVINAKEGLFWTDPLPNLYFTRDPAAAIGCGINIHCMRKKARAIESLFMQYIRKYHVSFKDIPLWYNRDIPYSIEGGDILILSNKILAIGCSERTSTHGIEQFTKNVLSSELNTFKKVLVFNIPKARASMHLDTIFTMVDYDKFSIYDCSTATVSVYELTLDNHGSLKFHHQNNLLEKVLSKALDLPKVTLIECGTGDKIVSAREQWSDASNALAISPGVVVVYDRNEVTNQLFNDAGVKTIAIASSELSRGRGGPRCMTMPLHRDDVY